MMPKSGCRISELIMFKKDICVHTAVTVHGASPTTLADTRPR
jgi:hypothetical protein